MKTYAVYGLGAAIAVGILTLALYFLGYHTEVASLKTAQTVAMTGTMVIWLVAIILGTKARRAETPADEEFGYGRAFGAGFMVTVFAALFGVIVNFLYNQIVNPELREIMVEAQMQELQQRELTAVQIEAAEKVLHTMTHPAVQAITGFVTTLIIGTVMALIAGAFLRRPAGQLERELPPTLG
jgi:magnesium-transporting ATPase (P-type)